ncbi:MAG: hypothetical protein PHG73_05470 [Pygmaiobacter sp.]|nr:hypothetical protein [Pygmaiobacter sp.]
MRYITLGGREYPILATCNVDKVVTSRYNAALLEAEEKAMLEAEEKELNDAKTTKLVASRTKMAAKQYLADMGNSMLQIALMINEAVDYERIMNHRDISAEVPGYPLDEQKVGMLATINDLNNDANMTAVAEEFAECRGGEKNLTAAQILETAKALVRTL